MCSVIILYTKWFKINTVNYINNVFNNFKGYYTTTIKGC